MKFRLLILVLVWALVLPSAGAGPNPLCTTVTTAAGEKSLEEQWKEVGLEFSLLTHIVNNRVAYENEIKFRRALKAIQALLFLHGDRLTIMPRGWGHSDLVLGQKVLEMGGVDIYRVPNNADMDANWAISRVQWLKVFPLEREAIDFDALLTFAINRSDKSRESFLTATAYNVAFYEVDPHSRIEPIDSRQEKVIDTGDELVGTGVLLAQNNGHLIIRGTIEGSPAREAGLKERDEVISIDGKPVKGLSFEEATARMAGKPGQRRRITIRRGHQDTTLAFELKSFHLPLVIHRLMNFDGGKIGYLPVSDFSSQHLAQQLRASIQELTARGADGLVLDLRDNLGGRLDFAVDVLSLFLGKDKKVALSRELETGEGELYVTTDKQETDLPLVVLVNHSSASASELVAGVLQHYKRAIIVGEPTYGKGTVQGQVHAQGPFARYPVYFYQTYAMYFLPMGRSPQIHGVPLDFVAHRKPEIRPEELDFGREADLEGAIENPKKPIELPFRKDREELRKCLAQTGTATRSYHSDRRNDFGYDYQLLVAADVMRCLWRL